MFAYCPKNCHDQLCLFQQPTIKGGHHPYFVQIPHAVMKNVFYLLYNMLVIIFNHYLQGVKVVKTNSIHNSLHSVGGIQVILPLFSQIDANQQEEAFDHNIWFDFSIPFRYNFYFYSANLLSVVENLLGTSTTAQQQFLHVHGFAIIAGVLSNSNDQHLTMNLLEVRIIKCF